MAGFLFMNVVRLTKKLISIPSYVDSKTDETKLGNYLCQLLPFQKQMVAKNRFNLILPGKNPSLLVVGHIDTVTPQPSWVTNPFRPVNKQNRIYGLGAADMKSSLAAFLTALTQVWSKIAITKLRLLLYVDEEYDFLGMKKFVKSEFIKVSPRLILSLDGKLKIQSGCRGCIELNLKFTGKSGHSAEPESGINAIAKAVKVVDRLKQSLTDTVNLAYLKGGRKFDGNIIPAQCFITIEVRPSSKKINAAWVINQLQRFSQQEKVGLKVLKIRHDLNAWLPKAGSKTELVSGYVDVQMLNNVIKAPMVVFGTGGMNEHGPNEYVPIKNLLKAQQWYQKILLKYCSK